MKQLTEKQKLIQELIDIYNGQSNIQRKKIIRALRFYQGIVKRSPFVLKFLGFFATCDDSQKKTFINYLGYQASMQRSFGEGTPDTNAVSEEDPSIESLSDEELMSKKEPL